jgi:hypothetical protein
MSGTLHVDIEIQDDLTVLLCTVSHGLYSKRVRLRKPDGSEFTPDDYVRLGTDHAYLSELFDAAIERGDFAEEGGAR